MLDNDLDMESATMLAKIGSEKGIMLSGMTCDQIMAGFSNQDLQPADGILIGSDLQFMAVTTLSLGDSNAVVTTLAIGGNSIGDEGAKAIAEALKVNTSLLKTPF